MLNKSIVGGLLSALSALCCAACSDEAIMSQSAVVAPVPPAVVPRAVPAPARSKAAPRATREVESSTDRQRKVALWFAKYDDIRHAAQMTPAEKGNAHKFGTAALAGNIADREASQKLLTDLSGRYKVAQEALTSLSMMPETAELQIKYSKYFQCGERFFDRYCKQLSKPSDPKATIALLEESRLELALHDLSNKVLDRTLRKKFDIPAYKWN